MNDDELSPERAELLNLRARVVVAERAALAALEAMLLIRPEQLTVILESTRKGLAEGYLDETFAPDLHHPVERAFVAKEVTAHASPPKRNGLRRRDQRPRQWLMRHR